MLATIGSAIGLFAAIPAVIAYNRFTHRLGQVEAHQLELASAG